MSQINWPQVDFKYHDYFGGPFVEIKTNEVDKWGEFLVRFYEVIGDRKELVDTHTMWGNNWYESTRKFYTNWYIEVLGFQNNKIVKVAWDKFDLFDRKVAIWVEHEDINFHQEIIPVIEEFTNKHKCHTTVVSQFAPSLSSTNKHVGFMSVLTTEEARTSCFAVYRVGVLTNPEVNIRLAWEDLKTEPIYYSNRIYYDNFHPRNIFKLNLTPQEIARDILFGFDTNDLSYNSYYLSNKRILSSKEVWLP